MNILIRVLFTALCTGPLLFAEPAGVDPALLAKATEGDLAAQVALGEKLAAGVDVPQDLKQAAEWYRKAAEQGSAAGEVHLAELYRDGRGVPRDKAPGRGVVSQGRRAG
jgi:TPR repeat protein